MTTRSNGSSSAIALNRLGKFESWLAAGNRTMSTTGGAASEAEQEIITKSQLAARHLILNRPKRLNALNWDMINSMKPQLEAWELSDLAKVVLLKGSGGKGFCAGGDVRKLSSKAVIELSAKNDPLALKFFEDEYKVDHFIATMTTPFVSVMNGITMGGGVGLSVHAAFRIATENTLFAMPETAIGFFPDVGGSFFLSRLDGHIGAYLGMTGKRLKGLDVLYAGIATHYVPSNRLPALEARLSELETQNLDVINDAIEDFTEVDTAESFMLDAETRKSIDKVFGKKTVEDIMAALEKEESAWAKETKDTLLKMSPSSLKITLEQVKQGAQKSIKSCFKMEYGMVQQSLADHDFAEGVIASLVNKTTPQWKPSALSEVNTKDIMNRYFNTPPAHELEFLSDKDYSQYPHRKYALPTENDIKLVVTGEAPDIGDYALSEKEVVDWFLKERKGKRGVAEKVKAVLKQHANVVGEGEAQSLKWIY
ncbi:ClpP/crotonase-like domain-containing protein [Umbelopsis sp. PMI_123]|nr:ClpP/crotonase-like domain-containing protein [Umbelopsis sp. PMI_123]